MDLTPLYEKYGHELDDFWERRQNRPRYRRDCHLFGRPIRLTSNDQGVLQAIDHCIPLYSVAPVTHDVSFHIQLVVQAGPISPGPPPEDLFDHIQYTGDADWLMMHLGAWGQCYVDLMAGRAWAVLAPPLAERPDLVGMCLLNTVLTNFFIAHGFAMLHASCLVRGERVLLLMAPHNSGKSTTALRLALAGYRLLSDSMIFLSMRQDEVQLLGFPVGKVKLRQDMLSEFPHLRPLLLPEHVRHEIKFSFDLRKFDPDLVYESAIRPSSIDLCLLERSEEAHTSLKPAEQDTVMKAVMANSLFYDTATVWHRNLALIGRLLERTRCHHLTIGRNGTAIVAAVAGLWEGDTP
jgi:hypothetical protein